MGAAEIDAGHVVTDDVVIFRFPDSDRGLRAVKLLQEIVRPRWGIDFVRMPNHDSWTLLFPRPDADRMEYKLEIVNTDGNGEAILDPHNPKTAPGPFGEKSVLEFPGYERPSWLEREAPGGDIEPFDLRSRSIRARVEGLLWRSPGRDAAEPLPLLVVHDGPEYAQLSSLTHLLDVAVAEGWLPPMRAALLQPRDRDEIYSASAAYSRALANEILPGLAELAPAPHQRSMRIGMGASLGALAMLQTHRRYPAVFGGLFLQSGSFFRQRYDHHELHFKRFRRIARFAGQVLATQSWSQPIPIAMTCGTADENLANNRAMQEALTTQGYEVTFAENRDAHNWVGWRDTFDPALVEFLAKVWT